MRRTLLLSAILAALVFAWIWVSQSRPERHSSSFYGAGFLARSEVERDEVWTGLHHQLDSMGFNPEPTPQENQQPSTVASRTGEGAGEHKVRYMKHLSGVGTLHVALELTALHIHTKAEWEARTPKESPRLARHEAARAALVLDDWFRARTETNRVPQEIRDRTTELLKAMQKH